MPAALSCPPREWERELCPSWGVAGSAAWGPGLNFQTPTCKVDTSTGPLSCPTRKNSTVTVFFSGRRDAPERWVKSGKARARAQAEAKASDRSQTICSTESGAVVKGSEAGLGRGDGTQGPTHGSRHQEVLGPQSWVRGHCGNNLDGDAPAKPSSQGPSPESLSHDVRRKCQPPDGVNCLSRQEGRTCSAAQRTQAQEAWVRVSDLIWGRPFHIGTLSIPGSGKAGVARCGRGSIIRTGDTVGRSALRSGGLSHRPRPTGQHAATRSSGARAGPAPQKNSPECTDGFPAAGRSARAG